MLTFQKPHENHTKNPTDSGNSCEFLLKVPFDEKDDAKTIARNNGRYLRWIPNRKLWGYTSTELPKTLQKYDVTPKPKAKIIPTAEQAAPIESPDIGEIKKIKAFAGTGKTTTLDAYARARPTKRALYIAFNKSVADEAKIRFPENTTTVTAHGLARMALNPNLQKKIIGNNPRPNKAQEHFEGRELSNLEAVLILQTLENFLNSNDPSISEEHCPEQDKLEEVKFKNDVNHHETIPDGWQEKAVEFSKELWLSMIDPDGEWPMTHNGYLKHFAISKPHLDYDIILLDEAQDTNPVVEGIVTRQCTHAQIILVGDSHQQIYTWRGAIDSMERIQTTQTYNLTSSFRFGKNIANLANIILQRCKGEPSRLVGHCPEDYVYLNKTSPFTKMVFEKRPVKHTRICRTSVGLFNEAITTIEKIKKWSARNPNEPQLKIAFVGTTGAENFSPKRHYDMGLILDIFHLFNSNTHRIRDPYVKSFLNISELREIAEDPALNAADLKKALKLSEAYPKNLEVLIGDVEKYAASPDDPNTWITFTTAHRSKGLEWENVALSDDFQSLHEDGKPKPRPDLIDEETNLLYVAITRAQKRVELNADLNLLLKKTKK
jgi:F-box protein 18 (helicase)